MSRKIHWVSKSSDKKIGKVLASYSPIETCPDSCDLKDGGCYAWGLFYLRVLGKKISSGKLFKPLKVAMSERTIDCKIARHRVAGDVVGDIEGTLEEIKEIEEAGLINIGYTHYWKDDRAQPLKEYFRASCQNEEELMLARSMGWGATLVVPENTSNKIKLSNGEVAIMCPVIKEEKRITEKIELMSFDSKRDKQAAKKEMKSNIKINCNSCTLCKINDKTKKIAVMFEVHGSKSTISNATKKVEVI